MLGFAFEAPAERAPDPADLNPFTSASATLAVLQHVLRGSGQDDLSTSTPCTEFTLGQLETHLLSSLSSLTSHQVWYVSFPRPW